MEKTGQTDSVCKTRVLVSVTYSELAIMYWIVFSHLYFNHHSNAFRQHVATIRYCYTVFISAHLKWWKSYKDHWVKNYFFLPPLIKRLLVESLKKPYVKSLKHTQSFFLNVFSTYTSAFVVLSVGIGPGRWNIIQGDCRFSLWWQSDHESPPCVDKCILAQCG